MAASQQCTLPFYYYTSEPEWPCYGAPRALSHQGKQVPAAPIRYRYALSRVLVLVLPLLIVGLVAAAVVAATSSSRRQEYHGTRLDNDEKDFTEEDTSLLIGSGGLSREAPAETFKPRRLVDTGGKHIAANATETPEITVNTPARYHGDIEFEPPRRPGETTGNLSPFFHTTSSATDKSSPPTPPKPSAGLGDVMRASIQDLLSAMEAASLTPSHRKQIVPQSPSIIKPLHGETPDAGMTASRVGAFSEGGRGKSSREGAFSSARCYPRRHIIRPRQPRSYWCTEGSAQGGVHVPQRILRPQLHVHRRCGHENLGRGPSETGVSPRRFCLADDMAVPAVSSGPHRESWGIPPRSPAGTLQRTFSPRWPLFLHVILSASPRLRAGAEPPELPTPMSGQPSS
ncbi:uncharacterized protein [Dermacentor albipictus]|uniref:uncharacterized protein isoform X2 n=1 Tax=Dermacentor albipictus TaxID=60249 RepID=UPI0038FCB668